MDNTAVAAEMYSHEADAPTGQHMCPHHTRDFQLSATGARCVTVGRQRGLFVPR